MLLTLTHLRTHYGSAERYITEHLGLSAAAVSQIRRGLVIDLAEGEEAVDWRSYSHLLTPTNSEVEVAAVAAAAAVVAEANGNGNHAAGEVEGKEEPRL